MKSGAEYRRASSVSRARRPQAHCGIVRICRTSKEGPFFPFENFPANSNSYEALTFGSLAGLSLDAHRIMKEEW
jgi:hypothetical protein